MAVVRDHPYGNARFVVEISGLQDQAFCEVHLPELTAAAVEFREGGDRELSSQKLPGRPGFGTLILRRGFHGSLELYEWWRQAVDGISGGIRTVLVRLLDEAAANVVAEWRISGAWPTRYYFSPLRGTGCEILVETAEIACEHLELR